MGWGPSGAPVAAPGSPGPAENTGEALLRRLGPGCVHQGLLQAAPRWGPTLSLGQPLCWPHNAKAKLGALSRVWATLPPTQAPSPQCHRAIPTLSHTQLVWKPLGPPHIHQLIPLSAAPAQLAPLGMTGTQGPGARHVLWPPPDRCCTTPPCSQGQGRGQRALGKGNGAVHSQGPLGAGVLSVRPCP